MCRDCIRSSFSLGYYGGNVFSNSDVSEAATGRPNVGIAGIEANSVTRNAVFLKRRGMASAKEDFQATSAGST